MSSIFDLNSESSDSEDNDYVPDGDVSEDEEYCDDQIDSDEEPKSKKFKSSPPKDIDSPPEAKKSADDVWGNFLKSVKSSPYGTKNETADKVDNKIGPDDSKSQTNDSLLKKTNVDKNGDKKVDSPIETASEVAHIEKANEDHPIEKLKEDASIKKASEELSIKKDLENSSKEDFKSDINQKKEKPDVLICRPRTGGLASFLTSVGGKGKKPSVLEKSLSDWKKFKEEEGIEKDLETFNKGRDGFIERQRFLARADVREFENERSIRLAKKKPT